MAGLWQRTGNVTVTNGSKTITGFGTKWKTGTLPIQKGHTFYGPDNAAYEVDTVVSDESILLVDTYRGGTLANQAYRIDITRTSTISQFAADLASLVAKYRSWFDGMMTWLTGSGDVAILNPDTGANVTIPSWKKVASEGEGQTARAKVEADRAKTEADRALTEAGRAAGIVAAAALPLPDVWAPLSDSLRLITGYGRDVLVGSDVVARMVNFSRNSTATYIGKDGQLKTAAVNEPRFEKEGLLLEGQSTNLVPWSSGYNGETPAWTAANYSMSKRPDGVLITPAVGVAEKCVRVGHNLFPDLPDRPLSITVEVKGNGYDMVVLGFRSSYVASIDNGIGVSLVDGTVKQTNHGLNVTRFEPLPDGFVRITVSTPSYTSTTPEWRSLVVGCGSMSEDYRAFSAYDADGVKGVIVRNIQLEALPFASSYIPTNGAAVTRAADVCWIPVENGGLPGMDNEKTMSLTSNILGVNGPFNFILATPWGAIDYTLTHERVSGNTPELAMNTPVALKTSVRKVARFTKGGGCAAIFGDIQKTGPTADWSLSTSRIVIGSMNESGANPHFGHVKDLKIWLKPLSDAQMKAIA